MRRISWKKIFASWLAVLAIAVGWLLVEPQSASARSEERRVGRV